MRDKNGVELKSGDTVRAVWKDAATGVSINGFTGVVQDDFTVRHVTPHGVITHILHPLSSEFQFEVISSA